MEYQSHNHHTAAPVATGGTSSLERGGHDIREFTSDDEDTESTDTTQAHFVCSDEAFLMCEAIELSSRQTLLGNDGGDGPASGNTHRNTYGAALSSKEIQSRPPPPLPPPNYKLPPVICRIPNTAFGIAMGLAGNAIMWKAAASPTSMIGQAIPETTMVLAYTFWTAACIAAMCIFTAYLYKALTNFKLVKDEFRNAGRVHFMNTPHLVALMLAIGFPMEASATDLRVIWGIGLLMQLVLSQCIYMDWLFSESHNITVAAAPPFLLSTVGWFLLSVLGQNVGVTQAWGIPIPAYCLGAGSAMYLLVVIMIVQRLHQMPDAKGSPSMTLLIAPPSVGVVALDLLDEDSESFPLSSQLVLGWCFLLLILLAKLGPKIVKQPATLGAYWAYIFPLSALATATLRNEAMMKNGKIGIVLLSIFFVSVASTALVVVVGRMGIHIVATLTREDMEWMDPLVVMRMKKDRQELKVAWVPEPDLELAQRSHFRRTTSTTTRPWNL